MTSLSIKTFAEMIMTKPCLKSLVGAAMLLLLSGHVASADPDGACQDNYSDVIASSQDSAPDATAVPGVLNYTKIAQMVPAAGNSATVTASAETDAVKKGDTAKKQTDILPKEGQSSDADEASVFQPNDKDY